MQLAKTGWTPLMYAVKHGNIQIIKKLINSGSKLNYKSKNTPILIALKNHRKEDVIKLLINSGADLSITDEYGWTPLMYLIKNDYSYKLIKESIKINNTVKIKDNNKISPLIIALRKNSSSEIINLLIESEPELNYKESLNYYTPLIYCAKYITDPEILEKLLENGADPNIYVGNRILDKLYSTKAIDLIDEFNQEIKDSNIYEKIKSATNNNFLQKIVPNKIDRIDEKNIMSGKKSKKNKIESLYNKVNDKLTYKGIRKIDTKNNNIVIKSYLSKVLCKLDSKGEIEKIKWRGLGKLTILLIFFMLMEPWFAILLLISYIEKKKIEKEINEIINPTYDLIGK